MFAAVLTAYLETYQIAFSESWSVAKAGAIMDYCLTIVFLMDMGINFNLAYYNERDKLVYERRDIARHYMKFWFWIDFLSVFPFFAIAMVLSRNIGEDRTQNNQDPLYFLRLFKLLRLVRLHRVFTFFRIIRYSRKMPVVATILLRNFSVVFFWCHLWACIMYFISREYNFDPDNTWIGAAHETLNEFQRYALSLYWSVTTFSTTGYGDWSPVNSVEQIFCVIYMQLNVVIMAWVIGSITLLIVKNDEHTSLYHDTLQMLFKYASLHEFDEKLTKRLMVQLKLGFKSRDIADEQVLRFFPAVVRRKILRRLYMQHLLSTKLMNGTRQQYIDSFLSLCSVEIFSPGEELLLRGAVSSDLYLLVEGTVETSTEDDKLVDDEDFNLRHLSFSERKGEIFSEADTSFSYRGATGKIERNSGEFLNDLGFFTESSECYTVRTCNSCKVLVMSRSHYKEITADYPGSAGVVLRNLLSKYGDLQSELFQTKALSLNDMTKSKVSWSSDVNMAQDDFHQDGTVAAIRQLIEMRINKQIDEHTNLFCFAASRGDVGTIVTMCDQGFDPDSSDYDNVTALMVASRKGNVEVVSKLLEYKANPNLKDIHGNSALYEATKNNNEDVAEILLKQGGELSLNENITANALCHAVYVGDIMMLKQMLKAKAQANASDYDRRTAAHIAASEGNVAALKLLVEFGADLTLEDRWGHTVRSEAEKAQNGKMSAYLDSLNHTES